MNFREAKIFVVAAVLGLLFCLLSVMSHSTSNRRWEARWRISIAPLATNSASVTMTTMTNLVIGIGQPDFLSAAVGRAGLAEADRPRIGAHLHGGTPILEVRVSALGRQNTESLHSAMEFALSRLLSEQGWKYEVVDDGLLTETKSSLEHAWDRIIKLLP